MNLTVVSAASRMAGAAALGMGAGYLTGNIDDFDILGIAVGAAGGNPGVGVALGCLLSR